MRLGVPISSFLTSLSLQATTQVSLFFSFSFVMLVNSCGNLKIFGLGCASNELKIIAQLFPTNMFSSSMLHAITQKVLSIDFPPSLTPVTLFYNRFELPLSLVMSHSSLFCLNLFRLSLPSPCVINFSSSSLCDWSSPSIFACLYFTCEFEPWFIGFFLYKFTTWSVSSLSWIFPRRP